MNTALDLYHRGITSARARFADSRWVAHYVEGRPDPDVLERFLIHYCALGYQMTRPVEGWIRRAGERCVALGIGALGEALVQHARHEAGHEAWMVNDARALADRRARAGRACLDVERLIGGPATPGIERYVRLHEEAIAGDAPYAQIAIEYEVERLSVTYGAAFIRRCVEGLGADVRGCLSFLSDHVALDVGHTHWNARQLARFLDGRPDSLGALVDAGAAALDAYGMFLDDCSRLAERPGSGIASGVD